MMVDVAMLSEDSIVCWEDESTRGSAPSAGTWKDFGVVENFTELGPELQLQRHFPAGSGREGNDISVRGRNYGAQIEFQVIEPRVLGYAWGEEDSAPSQIGSTSFYRHTVGPTDRGQLPSMSVQMRDKQGANASSASTSKTTFLETVCNGLTLSGEPINDDGSGGALNASMELMPHDDDDSVADKAVSLSSKEPYKSTHSEINLWGETDVRLNSWEFEFRNNASFKRFWNTNNDGTPQDAPPERAEAILRATIEADGNTYSNLSSKQLRNAIDDEEAGDCTLEFVRTADEDEFQINCTSVQPISPEKSRESGPVEYDIEAWVLSSTFEYVDSNSSRFFPS